LRRRKQLPVGSSLVVKNYAKLKGREMMSQTAMRRSMRQHRRRTAPRQIEALQGGASRIQTHQVDTQRAVDRVLLAPVLYPSQFDDIWHRSRARRNEQLLAKAVVQQAFGDLLKYRHARRRREQRVYRDAYNWVASDDRRWPYSFVNLCEVLGLSPAALREQLLDVPAARRPAAA
jgi:hypothetical protein